MAEDGIRIRGADKLQRDLGKFNPKLKENMRPRMTRAAIFVTREAQKRIRGARATNPPDLLGIVTGRLRGSLSHRIEDEGLTATVGTNVEYARKNELGEGVRARPYLGPGLDASREFILKEVGAGVDATLKEI